MVYYSQRHSPMKRELVGGQPPVSSFLARLAEEQAPFGLAPKTPESLKRESEGAPIPVKGTVFKQTQCWRYC